MRRNLVVGNWKLNHSQSETIDFLSLLNEKKITNDNLWIAPQVLHMSESINYAGKVKIGSQNCCHADSGAFTGEISPNQLSSIGAHFTIIGHSERRHIFSESDEMINKKVTNSLANNLETILCIGETLEQRESNKTNDILKQQLTDGLKNIDFSEKLVIAYEPVWAIGTGKTASPEMANETHAVVRSLLAEIFDKEKSELTPILYGGSVKPENIKDLISCQDIDGALIGGASLKVESFHSIYKSVFNL